MRRLLIAGSLFLLVAACGDPAKELYETAQFEEQQFNKPHATELYRKIVKEHSDSPYAPRARSRLAELEKP